MAIALAACVSLAGYSLAGEVDNEDQDVWVVFDRIGIPTQAGQEGRDSGAGRSGAAADAGGAQHWRIEQRGNAATASSTIDDRLAAIWAASAPAGTGRRDGGRFNPDRAAIWISDRSPMSYVRTSLESGGGAARDEGASARRVPVGGGVDEFYIRALICSYPWPCAEALAIAWCESRFDPQARNGQHAGLFQIALNWHLDKFGGADPFDPAANVRVAYGIWLDYGGHWTAWSCAR